MTTPKPTLGYPSRTAAVVDLRAKGLSPREIADQIGISVKNVRALHYCAARGDYHAVKPRTLRLTRETAQALAGHAAARGLTVPDLAERLVETALRDGMIDAILDDRENMP